MSNTLTPARFVTKWSKVTLSERAASQEHFIDLCRLLGQPTPAEQDATGTVYTFEKGVTPAGGASKGAKGAYGFADVWSRGRFAWEYKRKDKYRDLREAYRQLCQYREALENPPLLIVSDIARTEIHTNFTGTAKQIHTIELSNLAEPASLDLLRRVFTDPLSFKPTLTPERITEEIAERFGRLGEGAKELNALRERWLNPPEWIEPIAAAVDAADDFADVPEEARPLIRQSAIMARAAKDARLKKRTLTNLYNERPTWLRLAHEALDRAVLAAYAAVDGEGAWSEDWAEVWKETGAGRGLAEDHPLAKRRGEVDQAVLGNLLRMNLARSEQRE